jgi:prevent-host-death family protein
MDVGVRALRDKLSRHLAEVKDGHTITVTEHGRPIARIVPVQEMTTLERLIAEGRATPPARPKGPSPAPVHASGSVSELVAEQRG